MSLTESLPATYVVIAVAIANIVFGEVYWQMLKKKTSKHSDSSVFMFSLGGFVLLFLLAATSIFFLSSAYKDPAQSTKDFRLFVIVASFSGFFWGAIRKGFGKSS